MNSTVRSLSGKSDCDSKGVFICARFNWLIELQLVIWQRVNRLESLLLLRSQPFETSNISPYKHASILAAISDGQNMMAAV